MSLIGGSSVVNPLKQTEYNSILFQQEFYKDRDAADELRQKTLKKLDTTLSEDQTKYLRRRDKKTKEIEKEYDHYYINIEYLNSEREKFLRNSSSTEGNYRQDPSTSESQLKR